MIRPLPILYVVVVGCAGIPVGHSGDADAGAHVPERLVADVPDTVVLDTLVLDTLVLDTPPSVTPPPHVPPPTFAELGALAGLVHTSFQIPAGYSPSCTGESQSAGAAVGDYDGDGDADLFLSVYDAPSRLYRNQGDGTFEDVTVTSGIAMDGAWPSGPAWGDLDADGDLDLMVTYINGGFLSLWMNQGDGTFVEESGSRGFSPPEPDQVTCAKNWSISLGDPDMDGDLDVAVASWELVRGDYPMTRTQLYINDGTGHFTDRAAELGLHATSSGSFHFTPAFADIDEDGWPDLPMASDFLTNQLFLNRGDGSFRQHELEAGVTGVENAMGSVVIDFDEDGDLDWFITSIYDERADYYDFWGRTGNRLYLNDGDGTFTDGTEVSGLRDGGWAWGAAIFDVDNDADLDVGLTNGYDMGPVFETLVEPFLDDRLRMWVRQADGSFVDQAPAWGMDDPGQGRAFLPFDMDDDGDLDVLSTRWGDVPLLFRNEVAGESHWLRVRLRSSGPNTHGLGATVVVQRTPDDPPRRREVHGNSTYVGQVPAEAHFGLGGHGGPLHRVTVRWPYGDDIVLGDVEPDQVLVIEVD